MKRTSTIFAALLFGSALAAAPALAQTANGSPSGGSGPGMSSSTSGTSGTPMTNPTMDNDSMSSQDLPSMLKTADVTTVNVMHAGESGYKTSQSSGTTSTTPKEQAEIQAAIQGNPKIMSQLEANNVQVSDITAAQYDGNGVLTVYTK